jgi:hypothetical protein
MYVFDLALVSTLVLQKEQLLGAEREPTEALLVLGLCLRGVTLQCPIVVYVYLAWFVLIVLKV